jgi:1-acyl-sn-glycerol-3-phosphate acyltransferase
VKGTLPHHPGSVSLWPTLMADSRRTLPAADALPVQRRATPGFRIARLLLGPLYQLLFSLRVSGRSNIPGDRPYVLVSNHLNWLDPFTLLLAFPTEPRLHFLADPENLVKNRWHWWIVRKVGGYVPVDLKRHADTVLFEQVRKALAKGAVVTIFPEAAYGPREGELQELKKGFAHFAIQSGVPVLPVALSGTKDLWLGKTIELRIGHPLESRGLDVDQLVGIARDRMTELIPAYTERPGRQPFRRLLTRLLY